MISSNVIGVKVKEPKPSARVGPINARGANANPVKNVTVPGRSSSHERNRLFRPRHLFADAHAWHLADREAYAGATVGAEGWLAQTRPPAEETQTREMPMQAVEAWAWSVGEDCMSDFTDGFYAGFTLFGHLYVLGAVAGTVAIFSLALLICLIVFLMFSA